MLLFCCAGDAAGLDAVQERGLCPDDGQELRLYRSLDAAEQAGPGPTLVVDAAELGNDVRNGAAESTRVSAVPPAALRNVRPYRPPRSVTAAGGYVGCALPDDVALLMIFRRGVWDLPKGTKAPAESVEACAKREVCEEVGVDQVRILRSLGTTRHGYSRNGAYAVKTTHWYLMQTPERTFDPDHREGIERVAWARWTGARRHVGYETLRRHMDRIESRVRTTLADEAKRPDGETRL